MHDEHVLDNKSIKDSAVFDNNYNIDSLFSNLTEDIDNVNKFISHVTKQQRKIVNNEKELSFEREKLEKRISDFEHYKKITEEELENKKNQSEQYLLVQYNRLRKAEENFKSDMSKHLSEIEIERKSLEIERESLNNNKQQFESYKTLEMSRLKQKEEEIELSKEQFAKYKEITLKKIDFENKSLEQKCLKFKELMNQFNSNFKPVIEEE